MHYQPECHSDFGIRQRRKLVPVWQAGKRKLQHHHTSLSLMGATLVFGSAEIIFVRFPVGDVDPRTVHRQHTKSTKLVLLSVIAFELFAQNHDQTHPESQRHPSASSGESLFRNLGRVVAIRKMLVFGVTFLALRFLFLLANLRLIEFLLVFQNSQCRGKNLCEVGCGVHRRCNTKPDKIGKIERVFANSQVSLRSRLLKYSIGQLPRISANISLTKLVPYRTPTFILEHLESSLTKLPAKQPKSVRTLIFCHLCQVKLSSIETSSAGARV